MSKLFKILFLGFLALSLANCSSKEKKDEGVSILEPDSGSTEVTQEATPYDATQTDDAALSLAISGSDTGKFDGLYTVNFEYDKSHLTEEARALLASNVEWIRSNSDKLIQLEGHTDERGSTEYNLALGDRRARAVKEYLTSLGIDAKNLVVISYGKEKLLATGGSETDHAKNRRVNFLPVQQ